MWKKIPGKLNSPPAQSDFDQFPLEFSTSRIVSGVFYRIHSLNRATGHPFPPVYFSKRDFSRFDPSAGVGTMCVAESLAGALMEKFDDQWGPIGSLGRSLTTQQLQEHWVSLISVPTILVFDAGGPNLSAIGTDAQLFCGDHAIAREWALRLMNHPNAIDGIYYVSRHDTQRRNLALFARPSFLPEQHDPALVPSQLAAWRGRTSNGPKVVYGDKILLQLHPELNPALKELKVAITP